MKKIKLANGYLSIPKDWLVVNLNDALNCNYAAVIECKNYHKYKVPHFVYLNNKKCAIEYDDDFERSFYELCRKNWPKFSEIEELNNINQPIPDPKNKGKYLNAKEHLNSPIIGIFSIPNEKDLRDGEDTPFGAMIINE